MIAMNPTTCSQQLTCRTDVDVPPAVEPEVGPRECAVIPLALIPHRDVRNDAGASDEGQEFAGPVGRVGGQPDRAEVEAAPRALDHHTSRGHLVIGPRRCGLNIHNDRVLDIDEIVQAVTDEYRDNYATGWETFLERYYAAVRAKV